MLRHFKTVLVLVLSAAFIYVGLLNLLDRLDWQKPTDRVHWAQTSQGLEVRSLEAPRIIEGKNSLSPGDKLISINDTPIRTLDDYTEVLELLTHTLPPESRPPT